MTTTETKQYTRNTRVGINNLIAEATEIEKVGK